MFKRVLFLCCALVWWSACNTTPTTVSKDTQDSTTVATNHDEPPLAVQGAIQFKENRIERQEGKCDEANSAPCVKVDIRYPEPTNGSPELKQSIEKTLTASTLSDLLQNSEDLPTNKTIAQAVDDFVTSYQQEVKQNPDMIMPWEYTMEGKNTYQSDQVLTLMLNTYSFVGGAHPNSYISYYNFDPKTAQLIAAKDLISDVNTLLPIAEKHFRKAADIAPNERLSERGFDFAGGKFNLPQNIGFDGQNLVLYYNAYEVAAYAQGPTAVQIPLTEVGHLLKVK